MLLDGRFWLAGPRIAPTDVIIVAIDDATVREPGRYPLSRSTMARLVRGIAAHGPRAIGLDVLFLDPDTPEEDEALADALRDTGAVIGAAGLFGSNEGSLANPAIVGETSAVPRAERVLWPAQSVQRNAGVGLVNVSTDHAGTPRHVPLLIRAESTLHPSFALRVAAAAAGTDVKLERDRVSLGSVVSRTDLGLSLPLGLYGPRGSIPTVSALAVLRNEVPEDSIRDRVVVLGATAVGTGDTFTTPFDPVLPGVEVLATAVSHLVRGDGLVRDSMVRRVDAGAALALSLASVPLILTAPLSLATGSVVLLGVGWLALAALAFLEGYWLSASMPLAALAPTALLMILGRQVIDRRQAKRHATAEAALRLLQPRVLAERVSRDPSYLERPCKQDAAVLFIDLSGFTRVSERIGPYDTRNLLHEFHQLLEEKIRPYGGVVLTFMGDGAMIAFGVPDPLPDDACRAVKASLALVAGVRLWTRQVSSRFGVDLSVRLGGHFGSVVVSRLGSRTHQQITIAGDTVNVSSRLLEVAADEGAALAVSGDLLAAAGPLEPGLRAFGPVRAMDIRGRQDPLPVALHRFAGDETSLGGAMDLHSG